MAHSVKCSNCGAALKSQNPFVPGKKIKCPKCAKVFTIPEDDADADDDVEEPIDEPKKKKPVKPARDEDEDDEAPAKTAKKNAKKDDDEDDEDDEPKTNGKNKKGKKSDKKSKKKSGSPIILIIGGVAFLLLACGGCGISGWLASGYLRTTDPAKDRVADRAKDAPPIDKDGVKTDKDGPKIDETPVASLTALVFTKEFMDNEKAAVAKYQDKKVEVTGEIWVVKNANRFTLVGFKKDAKDLLGFSILCDVAPSEEEKLAQLKKGATVKVVGKVGRSISVTVNLTNCTVDEVGGGKISDKLPDVDKTKKDKTKKDKSKTDGLKDKSKTDGFEPIPEVKGDKNAREQALLANYRKFPPKKGAAYAVAVLNSPGRLSNGMAFSPSTNFLAAYSDDGPKPSIKIWNLNTLKTHIDVPLAKTPHNPLMRFSPNGAYLAIATQDPNGVRVFGTQNFQEVKSIPTTQEPVSLAFSADSSRLVVIAGDALKAAELKRFNTANWQEDKLNIKTKPFFDYLLAPDASQLLEINRASITFYDLGTGKPRQAKNPTTSTLVPQNSALSPDGRMLTFGMENAGLGDSPAVMNLQSMAVTKLFEEKVSLGAMQFTVDGKHVAYQPVSDRFRIIDTTSKKARDIYPNADLARGLAFSPGGVFVAVSTRDSIVLFSFEDIVADRK
jgi:WD40 repeat protein